MQQRREDLRHSGHAGGWNDFRKIEMRLEEKGLMRIARLFTEHPASLGESYAQHLRAALGYAGPLAVAAVAATLHAVFPFLFKTNASDTIRRLHDRMSKRCAICPSGPLHRPELFPPTRTAELT